MTFAVISTLRLFQVLVREVFMSGRACRLMIEIKDKHGQIKNIILRRKGMLNKVSTDKAPAAIGPYSQAVICGGLVFTSGQIPINPETGNIEAEGISAQTEQVMKNLGEILRTAGSSYDKAVKTTCFLANISDFASFNEVYAKYFTEKPARSCVAVKDLPKGALVEVEVIAEI